MIVFHRKKNHCALTKGDHSHEKYLHSTSEEDRQKHAFSGSPKNIAMDQLPTKFFLGILLMITMNILKLIRV